ncbi:MAG TPA: HIT family protein [Gemmatimonadales bacterium]|jgi:histidine triad (HIT) family protein|nr:HIT family protein [Gemmatimonadales bacterium]
MTCIFCDIVAGRAPASFVHRDELVAAFMSLHPTAPGECLVIPNTHIDHFTDVPDALAAHIMTVAQRIGRRMRASFPLQRVGYLVHGYGVAHAHMVIIPQQGPHHVTSDRLAHVVNGQVVFDLSRIPIADRDTLDAHARLLAEPGLAQA